MKIMPYTLRQSNEYVKKHHRHSKRVTGCRFTIAAIDDEGNIIGVAIVGRPVSRKIDQTHTAEVVRTCTEGVRNVNSFLYGACARIWKEMGGKNIITYTLEIESGASLKAAGFTLIGTTKPFPKGKGWTTRDKREWQPKVHSLTKYKRERKL